MSWDSDSLDKQKNTKVDEFIGEIPVVLDDGIVENIFVGNENGSSDSEVFRSPASD